MTAAIRNGQNSLPRGEPLTTDKPRTKQPTTHLTATHVSGIGWASPTRHQQCELWLVGYGTAVEKVPDTFYASVNCGWWAVPTLRDCCTRVCREKGS